MDGERELGDGVVARAILEGLAGGLLEYWWLWLSVAAFIVGARLLTDWSRRVEVGRRSERRARERALGRRGRNQ